VISLRGSVAISHVASLLLVHCRVLNNFWMDTACLCGDFALTVICGAA
jgi:hypothetical protein